MFTFVQAQTQYLQKSLLAQKNSPFYFQVQKALLLSLWQEKYISQAEYEQCLLLLEDEANLHG